MIMILADLLIRGGDIKVEEQKGAITASIETTAKISTDKLQKLENAVYNKIWEADAGMAPFYDLLNLCSPAKINLRFSYCLTIFVHISTPKNGINSGGGLFLCQGSRLWAADV